MIDGKQKVIYDIREKNRKKVMNYMKKRFRLKKWVKITLYLSILLGLSLAAFYMGRMTGFKFAQQKYRENLVSDEQIVFEEEIKEEEEEAVDQQYVLDPLILVNKSNPLPEEFEVELKLMYDKVNRAAEEAYQPLNDMLAAGRAEGLNFEICSSYRDVEVQKRLFAEDVEVLMAQGYTYEEAYAEVEKETMPPGHSEHSTGLAFDIVALSYQMLDAGQENTLETKWLHKHCAEYGFILRYPRGKEEITDISYESWHYRYVGVEAATYIMENEICLEEYLELLK